MVSLRRWQSSCDCSQAITRKANMAVLEGVGELKSLSESMEEQSQVSQPSLTMALEGDENSQYHRPKRRVVLYADRHCSMYVLIPFSVLSFSFSSSLVKLASPS